jgi:hypothetical protein
MFFGISLEIERNLKELRTSGLIIPGFQKVCVQHPSIEPEFFKEYPSIILPVPYASSIIHFSSDFPVANRSTVLRNDDFCFYVFLRKKSPVK